MGCHCLLRNYLLQPHLVFSHASHCLPHLCTLTPLSTNKDVQFESCELNFIWVQNEDCSPGGSISASSEKPLQSSSVGRSIYKVLVKGEFNTMKHSFYKMFFVSHETLMSPWRDLGQFSHSVMSDSLRPPWTAARQASLSITNSHSLLKLMSIELVMPSNHLILCRPLLLPPSIFPSIRVFSKESGFRIRWPKYWSFSFIIHPSNEYSGLISFRMDWLDLLAVQGTLKSLL